MNVYFAGIIGSGKTTLARAVAEGFGWRFDDLDRAMERSAGKSIGQIVQDEGWLGYRLREYRICKEFARSDRAVYGLGGGTPRYEWNVDALRGTGVNILLVADLELLVERARDNDRPRVHSGTTLAQDLAMIWETYQHLYYEFGHFAYRTDQGKSVAEEAEEILSILRRDYSVGGISG